MPETSYIWLSHVLDKKTPLYGGGTEWKCIRDKEIQKGDSCNTSLLELPSHAGTHVDTPLHFIKDGMAIEEYTSGDWVFLNSLLVFLEPAKGSLITPDNLNITKNEKTDIILFCTPFEKFRDDEIYWKENPGIAPEMAGYLLDLCPNLKAIGMNFISISSFKHRDIGRLSHRAFLGKGIRIIEDMHLISLKPGDILKKVIVLPLRFKGGDGAPCSVIAERAGYDNAS